MLIKKILGDPGFHGNNYGISPTKQIFSVQTIATTTTTRAPTTTTTIPNRNCVNFNDSLCEYFTSIIKGVCSTNSFIAGIRIDSYCCKSCTCQDSQFNCIFWSNYCNLLTKFNPHPCRKTCKICS